MVLEQVVSDSFLNIGVTFPDWILIIVALICLVMFGTGMRIGLMISTFLLGSTLMLFIFVGLATINILIVFFISIVFLTLSLLIKEVTPGAV